MSLYTAKPLRLALVRPLPKSFFLALQQHAPLVPIDPVKAHEQHENYSSIIRENVSTFITVDVDENYPDCCFIEDTALVVGRDVIITRIGAESRRDESKAVASAFADLISEGEEFQMHQLQHPACLDGGDVLQMSSRIFVGLSARTNEEAVKQLEKILAGRITAVPVGGGLHLKSVLSAVDDRTLLAADTPQAREMASKIIGALSEENVRCIFVPDVVASNVVRLGTKLLVQKGFPESEKILNGLAQELALEIITLDMSELVKADGALSCCSLLIP